MQHTSDFVCKFTRRVVDSYREEVRALGVWCLENSLSLKVNKTKEMTVDFRKQQRVHSPYLHRRDRGGQGGKLQVPWGTHH